MKLGLKLWSTNVENYLGEARRLFAEGFYDYLELYVLPGSMECLPAWKKLHEETGLLFVIHAAHSQHGVNLANPANEEVNLAAFKDAGAYADALDAERIVAHGGWYAEIAKDTESAKINAEVVRQLKLIGDERVIIENKPYLPIDGTERRLVGSTPAEIEAIMKGAGCGFCLDIDHAIASANGHGDDWREYLKSFLSLTPAMFHMSDIDISSPVDQHKHFGDGSLPLKEVVSLLPSDAHISIETVKDRPDNLDDFGRDVMALRNARDTSFSLRRAEMRDMKAVFELSNDPVVRANSIHTEPIEWATHVKWFSGKIIDAGSRFFVVESEGEFCGIVRFDRQEDVWVITIHLMPKFRGLGLGGCILGQAIAAAKVDHCLAYVKPDNLASNKMFQKFGFTYTGRVVSEVASTELNKYELHCV